jgi:hypothetical protein
MHFFAIKFPDGQTPLVLAFERREAATLKALLLDLRVQTGSIMSDPAEKLSFTRLHALMREEEAVLQKILGGVELNKTFDPNEVLDTTVGHTPLTLVLEQKWIRGFEILIAAGADVNMEGTTK